MHTFKMDHNLGVALKAILFALLYDIDHVNKAGSRAAFPHFKAAMFPFGASRLVRYPQLHRVDAQ